MTDVADVAAVASRAIGDDGEEIAVQYLTERGVTILARNVRYENGELDLVARTETDLLFVEVRLRQDDSRGTALESVTPRKRARVLRAARRWLSENGGTRRLVVRFDVVGIQRMPFQIDWVCGAFDASPY